MWSVRNELTSVKKIVVYTGTVSRETYPSDEVMTWPELMALGKAQGSEELDQRLANIAINQCSTLVYTSGKLKKYVTSFMNTPLCSFSKSSVPVKSSLQLLWGLLKHHLK